MMKTNKLKTAKKIVVRNKSRLQNWTTESIGIIITQKSFEIKGSDIKNVRGPLVDFIYNDKDLTTHIGNMKVHNG